jgi:NCAIR mutase (PurE)-related protein
MDDKLKDLLERLRAGSCSVEEAMRELRDLPFADLGFAKIDHHRALRTGYPEVIYCEGKTPEQVAAIAQKLAERSAVALATRASPEVFAAVKQALPGAVYHEQARLIVIGAPPQPKPDLPPVLVLTGGTADLPVAEEAAATAEAMGQRVERIYDVGVAGIHRLLRYREALASARAIIVVAGMDGALPSVVGGLVSAPVIAVPTSVGYGASFQGLAALLTMLNSCAAGVAVVNIDNGFGAGYFASLLCGTAGEESAP